MDIAVIGDYSSLAKGLAAKFGGTYVPLSPAHQLARVVLTEPDGFRFTVDVSKIEGGIEDDLGRRDFTIDAMALPLSDWEGSAPPSVIIDPFDGLGDLQRKEIRAVCSDVFRLDPARLLRAVRLSVRLAFNIDSTTRQTIYAQAPLLTSVAGERVRDEFMAILAVNGAKRHLLLMDGLGLLCAIIPELEHMKGVEQPREHFWDVFDHTIEAVDRVERVSSDFNQGNVPNLVPWDDKAEAHFSQEAGDGHSRRTMLKLAALFHDMAKPQTKTIDSNGRIRFFGHQTLGAEMALANMRRLRFSAKSAALVGSMVEHHLRPGQLSQGTDLPTGRAIYRYFRDVGDAAIDTLYLSLADYLAARGPEVHLEDWRRQTSRVRHILEIGLDQDSPYIRPPLVNGHDIIAQFHLEPGPKIGHFLGGVREAEAEGEVQTREDALAWLGRKIGPDRGGLNSPNGPAHPAGETSGGNVG